MARKPPRQTKRYSPFKFFPCLRCGQFTVAALIPQPRPFEKLELSDLTCKRCAAPHFLIAKIEDKMCWAVYDRDTRRYPSEFYDENPFVCVKLKDAPLTHSGNDDSPFPCYGPIVVFKRKRFTRQEIRTTWLRSGCRCHICQKKWRLGQHGRTGWHVDHFIPNSGGGRDTEMMDNFLVACARCNLKKGRGYTTRLVREALRSLFV